MTLYRALRNLSDGTRRGEVTRLPKLKPEQIAILQAQGTISPVAPPPLDLIPALEPYREKLAKHEVGTVETFLEATPAHLARWLRIRVEQARALQHEAETWLQPQEREA